MNNLKMNLYSVLTTVGLKDTAQTVLVNEFKNNLPALSELDEAVSKLQAVNKTYATLEDSLQAEVNQLRADIAELEQLILEVDVTKPKAIDEIMKVNAQKAMKQDRISAIMSALNALTAKGKAEKLDALVDGYTAIKKVSNECHALVETTKPVLNAINMIAIINALAVIDSENGDNFSEIVKTAQEIGAEQDRHKGQLLYHPYNTTYMSRKVAE